MGGYSSTPKKSKTSEEEISPDGTLQCAASWMQGWRASMEDAHIALLKVPQGHPPSSAAIGASRIGINSRTHKPPLGKSFSNNDRRTSADSLSRARQAQGISSEEVEAARTRRGRAVSYSAGDAEEAFLKPRPRNDILPVGDANTTSVTSNSSSEGSTKEAGGGDRGDGDDGNSTSTSVGAGWKAVDLLEDAALFGVFDGHGGKAVADFCKERLPGLLAASPDIRAGNWKDGFPRVYHALDDLLLSGEGQEETKTTGWGSSRVDGIGVGCTIVTALLDRKRKQCYVAHAGDSRCVLCRAGRAVQLTRDHKPTIFSEFARIVAAGGHVSRVGRVNDNLNLSRAIGDMVYKRNRLRLRKDQIISAEPDVCRFQVTPGVDEFLLLACDGVWEMMDTKQVVAFVRSGLRKGSTPQEVCESLLDACLSPEPRSTRYAGCDNMTVLLVLLEGWESALKTKAYTPGSTFSGGTFGSAGEAAAALSSTLPKISRKLANARPPLPIEFRVSNVTSAASSTVEPPPPGTNSSHDASTGGRAKTKKETTKKAPTDTSSQNERDKVKASTEGMETVGWPQRRIAAGRVAPPRTAHGIEFSLATFSAPLISTRLPAGSRASTGSYRRNKSARGSTTLPATVAGGGDPRTSVGDSSSVVSILPNGGRRRSKHLRSATAPMLPSPLINYGTRRSPSEERHHTAKTTTRPNSATTVAGELAAPSLRSQPSGNVNANANVTPTARGRQRELRAEGAVAVHTTVTGQGLGDQSARPEDAGLVFVPVSEDVIQPVDVTVTAVESPSINGATQLPL